ncbi:hypothetical protein ACWD3K_38000 [Streptomyces sp. NPDC002778]
MALIAIVLTHSPASADEDGRLVGTVCIDIQAGSTVYSVCDSQYDSLYVPNLRTHALNATAQNCPRNSYESRVRAAVESPYGDRPWSAESTRKNDPCPDHYLTVSGMRNAKLTININLAPSQFGSGTIAPL